jgi:3-hydroxyacyl-[acyl-carrier-protein] dehydratase
MPRLLFDISQIDMNQVTLDREAVKNINPHRYEFQLLDRVIHLDREKQQAVGELAITDQQFWVRGHIPGRPIFPGVLQIEAAAQLCSTISSIIPHDKEKSFFGFVGVDQIKFRKQVVPGDTLIILCQLLEIRRVARFEVQSLVEGKVVFSGIVLGSHL